MFYYVFFGVLTLAVFFEPTRWIAVGIYVLWLFHGYVIKRLFFVVKGREMEDFEYEEVFSKMYPLIGRFIPKQ